MRVEEIARLLPAIVRRSLYEGANLDRPPGASPDAPQPMAALLRTSERPLAVFLRLMERLHAPSEARLENLEDYFHPYDAPDAFVYYLASWFDLAPLFTERVTDRPGDYYFAGSVGRLRELSAAALRLANRRGTHTGLRDFLEVATGLEGFTIEEDETRPFHVTIACPSGAADKPLVLNLIREIVELEKPVYVTYELVVPRPEAAATAETETRGNDGESS